MIVPTLMIFDVTCILSTPGTPDVRYKPISFVAEIKPKAPSPIHIQLEPVLPISVSVKQLQQTNLSCRGQPNLH